MSSSSAEAAGTLEAVRASLRVERECCAALADVLRAERAAAAGHDLRGLIAVLRERETIQARWQGAARRRKELLGGGDTLAALAARDPSLRELNDCLIDAAGRVRREQAVNEALLQRSLDAVGELLGTIRRHLPTARYDGEAAITAAAPETPGAGWRA